MNKLLISLLVTASLSYANMINAIALTVNDTPITLYDIEKRKIEKKISKQDAVGQLIDEALFEELVKKYNITADIFDINNHIEKIAASNGMDIYTFKSIVKQKFNDYSVYEDQIRQLLIKEKVTEKLVRGNLQIANDEDLKIYYDNNKSKFQMSAAANVMQYSSANKQALEQALKNPMAIIQGVKKSRIELNQTNIDSKLRYIINETDTNKFTPIFTSNKEYVSLLILEKKDIKTLDFEDVKDRIFNIVMQDRERKYLKDYFEKQKLSADIKVLR